MKYVLLVVTLLFTLSCIISCVFFKEQNFQEHRRLPYKENSTNSTTIPKSLIVTTKDKSKIPKHILQQYRPYVQNKGYTLSIFDNNDCVAFLSKEYTPTVVRTFNQLKSGAHKADLFRYAYLYVYGGIYLDIKTILLKNLDEIIDFDKPLFYLTFSNNNRLYNGILCTPPNNRFFLDLLNDIVYGPSLTHYLQYCQSASRILKQVYLKNNRAYHKGLNNTYDSIPNVIMWKEIFCPAKNHCNNIKDRYGYCNFCVDEYDNKLFKIRDPEYGKSWT